MQVLNCNIGTDTGTLSLLQGSEATTGPYGSGWTHIKQSFVTYSNLKSKIQSPVFNVVRIARTTFVSQFHK